MLDHVNWYDFVVAVALMYGVWSGLRTGLSGEIIRLLGLVLMIVLGLTFYARVGTWLILYTGMTTELANLAAFVAIAVAVYLLSMALRVAVHRRMEQLRFAAMVENVGGGFAGFLRMVVVMAWLSALLALTRSQFWHEQVARDSWFGSTVVRELPAVSAVVDKTFPERAWFMQDIKRRPDPTPDEGTPPTSEKDKK